MSTADMYVKIILGIISIISALISAYVIPYLKQSSYWKQMGILNDFVTDCVRAANQLYTKDQWQEKKQYVTNLVLKFANDYGMGFTEDHIDAIIEGIVREIKVADGSGNNSNNITN